MSTALRPLLDRLSGGPRVVLALLLLVAGALVGLTATAPAATAPVVVAARALPAGAVVGSADLSVSHRPRADLPDGALASTTGLAGHRAVAAIARGEVLTAARLAPGGLAAAGPGRGVASVTVGRDAAGLVTVGDEVDLVVGGGGDPAGVEPGGGDPAGVTPTLLAGAARVLAVWPPRNAGDDVATLVVDVDTGEATRLAVVPPDEVVGVVVTAAR